MTTAALLLAAGESTRMGRLKQLLPWDDTTLLGWQVRQLRDAGVDDVVVVLGHAAEEIVAAVGTLAARIVVNEAYHEGRASSLRRGAEALSDETEAVLILSVAQPRPAWVSRRLLEARGEAGGLIIVPRSDGRRGHPVLLRGSLLPELRQVSEAELGLRAVMQRHREETNEIEIENECINIDLNSQSDFQDAYVSWQQGAWA